MECKKNVVSMTLKKCMFSVDSLGKTRMKGTGLVNRMILCENKQD